LDEDFTKVAQVHPSWRLAIAERNRKTGDGREPPELVDWRMRKANEARRAPGRSGLIAPPNLDLITKAAPWASSSEAVTG
jgi:hypothetical protein